MITPPWRDLRPQDYYVYIHRAADQHHPFYIGKGSRKRGWAKDSGRSNAWIAMSAGKNVSIEIVQSGMSEADAYDLEISLIQSAKDSGITLVNTSLGGGGNSGFVSSKRVRVFTSLMEQFESIMHATLYLRANGYERASGSNIGAACKGGFEFIYGRAWSSKYFPDHPCSTEIRDAIRKSNMKHASKPVWSSDNLKFLSIRDAVNYLRENGYLLASQGNISRAIKCKTVAYDRMWAFAELKCLASMSSKDSWRAKVSKSVAGSNGMIFPSMQDAASWLRGNGYPNATYNSISKCCNGKQISAYGQQWRFRSVG